MAIPGVFRITLFALALAMAPCGHALDYEREHRRGVAKCGAIDPGESTSGLWLNPAGYQAYYHRSECLQSLAVRLRDAALCDEVRRKWALFASTWGYSKKNCRTLVREGMAEDAARIGALRRGYEAGPFRLLDFRVERNGNGRDYDLIPSFGASGFHHGYHLAVYVVQDGRKFLFTENGHYLRGGERIRLFEYRRDLEKRIPGFDPNGPWEMEAEVILSIGTGSQRGLWSPAFIREHFPPEARTQRLRKQAVELR